MIKNISGVIHKAYINKISLSPLSTINYSTTVTNKLFISRCTLFNLNCETFRIRVFSNKSSNKSTDSKEKSIKVKSSISDKNKKRPLDQSSKKPAINVRCGIETRRAAREQRKNARRRNQISELSVKEKIIEVSASGIPVQSLAKKLTCTPADIVKIMFMKGISLQINQQLDPSLVKMICETKGFEVWDAKDNSQKLSSNFISEHDIEFVAPRAPVVTIMGHVDHGKTSLLDYIRKTMVVAGEAGGITQRVSAYNVDVPTEQTKSGVASVCFLDTPGHEAFSGMRTRGVKVTDVVVIVVAADEGLRPQTLEAIQHVKESDIPAVIAITKIDKNEADPEKVKQQLAEVNLLAEEWGGQTPIVNISALNGLGIPDLVDKVVILANLLDLRTNPFRPAEGTVIEAYLDKNFGPVAILLIQTGTLCVGSYIQVGKTYGKVRALQNETRGFVDKALTSTTIIMHGLNSVPLVGKMFSAFSSEFEARRMARMSSVEESDTNMKNSIDTQAGLRLSNVEGTQTINLMIKSDTRGSIEAIKAALTQLPQNKVALRYIVAETGDITRSDVDIAALTKSTVYGFNVTSSDALYSYAKDKGVKVRSHKIIYALIDDVRDVMEDNLPFVEGMKIIGSAEVSAVFGGGLAGRVAGCFVQSGSIIMDYACKIFRNRKIIHNSKINSLRQTKQKVSEVKQDKECGIGVDGFKDWEVGDLIECYEITKRKRKLEEAD